MVQVLNLDFCSLAKLPESLGMLTALTTLDVEGNGFLGDSLPLDLADPWELPRFPAELAGLSALRYLNLNSCGLAEIPLVRPVISTKHQALQHSGACVRSARSHLEIYTRVSNS